MNAEQLQDWLTEINNVSDDDLLIYVREPVKAAAFLASHSNSIQVW